MWDDKEKEQFIVSAVSVKGRKFLSSSIGDLDVYSAVVDVLPDEFLRHIPPGVRVYFNRENGTLVNLTGKKSLQ
jgi:hypothetical protein